MGLSPRLALSVLAGRGPSCILGSGAATRKDWQARNRRGFSDFYMQPLPDSDSEESSPSWIPKNRSEPIRHIACKKSARNLVRDLLENRNPSRQLILECNPGKLNRKFALTFYVPNILNWCLFIVNARVFRSEDNLARVSSRLTLCDLND